MRDAPHGVQFLLARRIHEPIATAGAMQFNVGMPYRRHVVYVLVARLNRR
jgi:hypothetical protein